MAVVFGESGCGKSFLASHMAMHIAAGWSWAGKATQAGAVVYITAEGARGLLKRMVAFRQFLKPAANVHFYVIADSPDLGKLRGFLSYTAVTTSDATRAFGQLQYVKTGNATNFGAMWHAGRQADRTGLCAARSLQAGQQGGLGDELDHGRRGLQVQDRRDDGFLCLAGRHQRG